jgi:hypothetical protein
MRYRRPFDAQQRQAAAASYRMFRRHLKTLQPTVSTATRDERAAFGRYHDLVQDFARELLTTDAKVDVRRLNDLEAAATAAGAKYQILRERCEIYMNPIEKLINPKSSRDVVKLLRSRGWSDTKIARPIRGDVNFVRLIADAQESFSMRHLNALARATESSVDLLIFEAMEPAGRKSHMRDSFESLREMIDTTGALKRAPVRKGTRKRGSGTKAA